MSNAIAILHFCTSPGEVSSSRHSEQALRAKSCNGAGTQGQVLQCNILIELTGYHPSGFDLLPFQPRRSLGLPGGSVAKVFEACSP